MSRTRAQQARYESARRLRAGGLSLRAIADLWGVTPEGVRRMTLDIPAPCHGRPGTPSRVRAEILRCYQDGETMEEIAAHVPVSRGSVGRFVKEAGISRPRTRMAKGSQPALEAAGGAPGQAGGDAEAEGR